MDAVESKMREKMEKANKHNKLEEKRINKDMKKAKDAKKP